MIRSNSTIPDGKRPVGSPSDFNPATAGVIVEAVRRGNFLETAAAMAGVTARTVRNEVNGIGRCGKFPNEL
jgi:hypothetical protein